MADFLDEKLQEIQGRLTELRPLVEEFHRLEQAERALSGVGGAARRGGEGGGGAAGGGERPAPSRRTRGAAGPRAGRPTTGRRGRPRGSGTRGNQALELVRSRPGITIPEVAEAMGIQQNYLYRVMPQLAEQGMVIKSGRGWHPREGAPATIPTDVEAAIADGADSQPAEVVAADGAATPAGAGPEGE